MSTSTYRSTEPPRPTNVDERFRKHEADDYYNRQSKQDSVAIGAVCFLAMIGLGMWIGIIEFVRWALS